MLYFKHDPSAVIFFFLYSYYVIFHQMLNYQVNNLAFHKDLIKSLFNLILLDNIQNSSSIPHCMRPHHMLVGLQPNCAREGYQAYPTDCICSQDPQAVADH